MSQLKKPLKLQDENSWKQRLSGYLSDSDIAVMESEAETEAIYNVTVLNNRWIPHQPFPKQEQFLKLDASEALYGGAARGGKSDSLLIGALQYVDVPGYSAILFRKTLTDLENPDGLIPRSHEWLANTPAHYDGQLHQWTFPSGAVLKFGFIGADVSMGVSKYKQQGARYQYVGWDELTQQDASDYFYLFSRLDRPNCEIHRPDGVGGFDQNCQLCQSAKSFPHWVPLRMRAATNPGGTGMRWVKEHFQIDRDEQTGEWVGRNPEAPFISARVQDNKAVDQKSYIDNLNRMEDHVTRRQLLEGDWGISEEGRFKQDWLRHYEVHKLANVWVDCGMDIWASNGAANVLRNIHQLTFMVRDEKVMFSKCRCFMTVDPAASEREGPGDVTRYRKEPSNTVFSVWVLTPKIDLLWIDCWAFQWEIPEGVKQLQKCYTKYRPEFIAIEANGTNLGFVQYAERTGLPVRRLLPGANDKVGRSLDAQIRMEQGKVFFPRNAPWLKETLSELFDWTGHKQQAADRIDTFSYAAMMVSQESGWGGRAWFPSDLPMVARV